MRSSQSTTVALAAAAGAVALLLLTTMPGTLAFLLPSPLTAAPGPLLPLNSRGLAASSSPSSSLAPAAVLLRQPPLATRRRWGGLPPMQQRAASDSHTDVSASAGGGRDEDEEEEAIPGKMKVSEIKAELELRGVSYAGVFERNELEALLLGARVKGKARPEILEQFNEAKETAVSGNQQPEIDWESAKSGDGSLPGGVDAEALQKLTENQELMALMANDKLQEFMKAVMEQDMAAMQRFAADQEVLRMMQRFQELAMEAGLDPTQFAQGGK